MSRVFTSLRSSSLILTWCVTSLVATAAIAQSDNANDWPCIQQLVPEVSAAVVWPVPITDDLKGEWHKDNAISQLASELGDVDSVTDAVRTKITTFAESVPESERNATLTILADGIVDVTNERRQLFIRGIKRYTRQQQAIASQVEEQLNKLDALEGDSSEAAVAQRLELRETTQWHQRVFDQREQAITALCDRPVELETTLGDVLRELAQFLP